MYLLLSRLCAVLAGVLLLIGTASAARAEIADVNAAINKAGRQRMLSQRIAKVYFQVGMKIDADRSWRLLDSSVAQFDRQLNELKDFAPTPEIRKTYQTLERVWSSYRDALMAATPNKADGRKVLELSDEVLRLAHQGTVQLEKHAGTSTAWQVSIAGRQRMLSQRMAKYYQAMTWGIASDAAMPELKKSRTEFVVAHHELKRAAGENRPLKSALDTIGRQWIFFDAALSQRGDTPYGAADVAAASELMLQEMETAVSLFEKRAN